MRLSRIKHYIKQIMPFRMVLKYEEKHDFMTDYFAWKALNLQVEFDKESKWESIVSVSGFGYSGSGAVIDLLREYDECLVHGLEEEGSNVIVADDDLGEVTFLSSSGGPIDIDSVIDSPISYMESEVLNRFAKMVYRNPIYNKNIQYREYIYQFFDSLIEDVHRIQGTLSPIFFPKLHSYIFRMHKFQKKEYYSLCQKFLYSLFNWQYRGAHKYLVLDQLCQPLKFRPDYCRKFIPNYKNIVVYRDPRDIYTIAKRLNIQWLEHDTVEHFIYRMKRQYAGLDIHSTSYLPIRFEELILDYDKTVSKIEKYLELGEHRRPQSCLDTSVSCKNIGMWKHAKDIPQSDYDKILAAMPQFCYDK